MKLLICILLLPLTASAQRLYIGDTIVWKPDTLLFVQAVHATVTVRYLPNDRGWVTLIVRTGSGEFVFTPSGPPRDFLRKATAIGKATIE